MKKQWQRGSFTVEAVIWIPIMVFLIIGTMQLGIRFFQDSLNRESYQRLQEPDIVQEFYNYQILGEIGEEIIND